MFDPCVLFESFADGLCIYSQDPRLGCLLVEGPLFVPVALPAIMKLSTSYPVLFMSIIRWEDLRTQHETTNRWIDIDAISGKLILKVYFG